MPTADPPRDIGLTPGLSLDAPAAGPARLRLQFQREQDRWRHTVYLLHDDGPIPVYQSIEGDDVDAWPASPPLQQCSQHVDSSERPVALLVGMAGQSHWSLSVETSQQPIGFAFDVACRAKERPLRLGSTYACLPQTTAAAGVPVAAGVSVQVEAWGQARVVRTAADHCQVLPADSTSAARFPVTFRWQYRIVLREPA